MLHTPSAALFIWPVAPTFSMELMVTPAAQDTTMCLSSMFAPISSRMKGMMCGFTARKSTSLWHTVSLLWGVRFTPIFCREGCKETQLASWAIYLPTKLRALCVVRPRGCWVRWERHYALEWVPFEVKKGHHRLLNHSPAQPTSGCSLCSCLPSRCGWWSQAGSLAPHPPILSLKILAEPYQTETVSSIIITLANCLISMLPGLPEASITPI